MKTKFYFGRKNQRVNYGLYKHVTVSNINDIDKPLSRWYRANIIKGEFSGWAYANTLPKDMKPIRKIDAEK